MKTIERLKVILLVVVLTASSVDFSSASEVTRIDRLEFVTPDSLSLFGWFVPTSTNQPIPLVALLPMYSHDHTSYDPFIAAVQKHYGETKERNLPAFPYILAFDLRGHGESIKKGSTTVDYKDRNKDEFRKIPSDVAFAIQELIKDTTLRIDTTSIMVIGASVGANAALMLTELLPNVSKVVMLSPGEEYIGLEPTDALKKFSGQTLIFTATQDGYSYDSSKKFAKLDSTRIELKAFESQDHGTNIINNDSEAMQYLLNWLFGDAD